MVDGLGQSTSHTGVVDRVSSGGDEAFGRASRETCTSSVSGARHGGARRGRNRAFARGVHALPATRARHFIGV
jgi:hypothetical protein